MKTRPLSTAAHVAKEIMYMECAVLIRPRSALRKRLWQAAGGCGWEGPVWAIYTLDRCFEPTHVLHFGDGSWLTPDSADLDDLILLEHIDGHGLEALFG